MKGSRSKGAAPGCSESEQTLSNTILTDGSGCFYCDLETEGAHPTCDRPGCDRQTHGSGPEGKRVLSYCPSCRDNALVTDGGLDAETVLSSVAPGDVVEIVGNPYRVVDIQEDEDDDGVLRVYDLVERTETIKAAGAGVGDTARRPCEAEGPRGHGHALPCVDRHPQHQQTHPSRGPSAALTNTSIPQSGQSGARLWG